MTLPIGPDYHYDIKTAAEPSLSPDGKSVAFSVKRFERGETAEFSSVYVQEIPSGARRQLSENAESPAWSPDGTRVAFLRKDSNGKTQLWVADAAGGAERLLTSHDRGVDVPAWAPDSKRIAYRADIDESDSDDGAPVVTRRIRYRQDGVGWRGDAFRQLFVIDLESGESTQITFDESEHGPPVWSPDGTKIAYLSDQGPFRDVTLRNEVYVISADGGSADRWSGGLFMSDAVTWSPDGEKLAVIGAQQVNQVGGYGLTCQGWVYVLQPGSYPVRLTDDSIRPISGANIPLGAGTPDMRWAEDGSIYFTADARGQSYVCGVNAESKQVRRITAGSEQILDWDVAPGAGIAVTAASDLERLGELYSVDLKSGERRKLTDLNDGYFEKHATAKLEKISVSSERMEVECRVWLPPDFDSSKSYPVLLDVHGGPHSVFYDAFYPIHQIAATNGYVVVAPNPRGSSSYGTEFATAVHGDWGGGDYVDVMAALSEVLRRPYADESRLVMHGSSYGGYMASWAVGHSQRFKAAVIAAPVTDLPSFYGTSDIGVPFSEVQFGGKRGDNLNWYVRHSPITYAESVNAPVLLIHGEDDHRVLIDQSEQYFVALKRADKLVEFVRMPNTSHGIFRAKSPRIRQEYFSRMLAWYDRFLNQPPDFTSNGVGHHAGRGAGKSARG